MDMAYGIRREDPPLMRQWVEYMQTRDELEYPSLERGEERDLRGLMPLIVVRLQEVMGVVDADDARWLCMRIVATAKESKAGGALAILGNVAECMAELYPGDLSKRFLSLLQRVACARAVRWRDRGADIGSADGNLQMADLKWRVQRVLVRCSLDGLRWALRLRDKDFERCRAGVARVVEEHLVARRLIPP